MDPPGVEPGARGHNSRAPTTAGPNKHRRQELNLQQSGYEPGALPLSYGGCVSKREARWMLPVKVATHHTPHKKLTFNNAKGLGRASSPGLLFFLNNAYYNRHPSVISFLVRVIKQKQLGLTT
jgi:hypothetical protein